MPTEQGLKTLDEIKAKWFPKGYRTKPQGGKDYRFSRKGQAEFKKAAQLQAIKHRQTIS
ncbi:hypothetical protein L1D41_03035 [Vibrio harveyi]|uniref:hypothetical protein n=1 Tax=Vibrio harveyi TaxID=669 RepID=UPI001EFED69B|nr:hypothetical protein [Vibrio harveyi]MCG9608654.1 hypothetical protein [Vibrio harveyi]MCG9666659.1 hypothetical protein [Vibrio harveyi]